MRRILLCCLLLALGGCGEQQDAFLIDPEHVFTCPEQCNCTSSAKGLEQIRCYKENVPSSVPIEQWEERPVDSMYQCDPGCIPSMPDGVLSCKCPPQETPFPQTLADITDETDPNKVCADETGWKERRWNADTQQWECRPVSPAIKDEDVIDPSHITKGPISTDDELHDGVHRQYVWFDGKWRGMVLGGGSLETGPLLIEDPEGRCRDCAPEADDPRCAYDQGTQSLRCPGISFTSGRYHAVTTPAEEHERLLSAILDELRSLKALMQERLPGPQRETDAEGGEQ